MMMLVRSVLVLLALLEILVSPCRANTAILNFPSGIACSEQDSLAAADARRISEAWPSLALGDERESLFTVEGQAASSGATGSESGYWVRVVLSQSQDRHFSSLLSWLPGELGSAFTVRASWPANHPIDVDLELYTASQMLRKGSHTPVDSPSEKATLSSQTLACTDVYLHIVSSRRAVAIPRSLPSIDVPGDRPRRWLWAGLDWLAEAYMGPLASIPASHDPSSSTASLKTPLHLIVEPLVLGVSPQRLLKDIGSLMLVVTLLWGGALAAGLISSGPQGLVRAIHDGLSRIGEMSRNR